MKRKAFQILIAQFYVQFVHILLWTFQFQVIINETLLRPSFVDGAPTQNSGHMELPACHKKYEGH